MIRLNGFGKTPRLRAALTLVIAVGLTSLGASSASGVGPDVVKPDLYGPLPDESISTVAWSHINSPEFATARAEWGDDPGLLSQIQYQLEFRAQTDFMSADAAYLGKLLAERPDNMGWRSMGLYMTDAEVREMERRDALGDKAPEVVEAMTGVRGADTREGELPDYGSNFGGIWGDQLDGGRLVLAVVDSSALDMSRLEAIVGGPGNLKVIEQPFSLNEIETYRTILDRELTSRGIRHDILAVRTERGRLLEVRVPDPMALATDSVSGVPSAAYSIVLGDAPRPAGRPWDMHSSSDFMPGQMFEIVLNGVKTGAGGTWSFNGHTSSFSYLVTCGHCFPPGYQNNAGAWVGEAVNFWQGYPGDSAHDLTPGDTFIVSVYQPASNLDAGRAETLYADDNCYHGDYDVQSPPSHCGWYMRHRAIDNSWEEGIDRSCASTPSSGKEWGPAYDYRCGYIVDVPYAGTNVRVDVTVRGGDSGAGFKWDYRIDGVLTSMDIYNKAIFMTAYDVKVNLGSTFDYNCAPTRTTQGPGSWAACPAVDA